MCLAIYGSIYLSRQLDQLAIYKHDRGVEPRSTENNSSLVQSERGTWTCDLRISSLTP